MVPLMTAKLEVLVNAAVTSVFDTMLSMPMTNVPMDGACFGSEVQIASAVGFTGRVTGVIYLYTTVPFAGRITAGLLGLSGPDAQREDYVNDAMGEMANMVVGNVKSRLVDAGYACVMTIPSIVRGSHLGIEAMSRTDVSRMRFRNGNDFLVVEVLIEKPSAAGQ